MTHKSLTALFALPLFACACSGPDEEVFGETQASLSASVGESCELEPLTRGEVTVDEQAACGTGLCISVGPNDAGLPETTECSCRCDGPEGSGPFCACPSGYSCTHLFDGLGFGGDQYAGSYCLAPQ